MNEYNRMKARITTLEQQQLLQEKSDQIDHRQEQIQQLEKVDPAAVKRARTFFPFKDDKPAATKAS